MVKVARAAETVCADSINTPLLGKKKIRPSRTGIFAWNDGNSPMMRAVAAILLLMGSIASEAKKFQTKKVVDLAGKTVVPGLTDSHCHIFGIGEREMRLNLEGTNTVEDFFAKVKERVAKAEPGQWITGRGWIETFWK